MKKYLVIAIAIQLFLSSCTKNSYEFQPNITWGGRIVALSKDPSNDNKIIAAAPSGGIFISTSRGSTWSHINLPVFEMNDVKFSSRASDVVVATASRDLKTTNGGGIWRSVDGGKTWSKPPTSVFMKDGSPVASHAFGISFEPKAPAGKLVRYTRAVKVYAGTEWGVAISNDEGATWRYNNISSFRQIKVYDVLAESNGKAIATTSDGIYRTTDGGNAWTFITSIFATTSTRSLCFAPANHNNVFLASQDYKIYYSGDFGITWKEIKSPGGKNREPFIRCTSQPQNVFGVTVNVTFLYYGNGVDLYRKILPNADNNNGNVFFANDWVKLGLDHTDPSDIVFDNSGTSLLLSGDGGVFNTTDGGNNWHITGSGNSGLNALQINEANAQENLENGRKYYIYFGTQDNQLWSSLDGGGTWGAFGNEGHSIQTKRRAVLATGNLMSLALDDSITQYGSQQGYASAADWNEVPQRAGDPVVFPGGDILDPNPLDRFVQLSFTKGFATPTRLTFDRYNFNRTDNGGTNWRRIGHMTYAPTAQYPKIGSSGEPVIYQPYSINDTTKNGFSKIGLVRLSQTNRVGEGLLETADGNGYGSLGTFPTEFKWYNVFAVNPTDPNHVIIADVGNSAIKVTKDGGRNWYAENALTTLITNYGTIDFYKIVDCCPKILVTCISFNPDNPDQIAIGTRENGIFFTWDRGNVWYKLDNTTQITNASSIFFYFDGTIMVSSYGRGLWKFKPKVSKISTRNLLIKDRVKGVRVFDLVTQKLSELGSLEQAGIGTGDRLIAANAQDTTLTLSKIIRQGITSFPITVAEDSMQQYEQKIQLTVPGDKLNESILRQSSDESFIDIPVRAFIYNRQNQVTGFVVSVEAYKLFRPGELVIKEDPGPYIQLLDDSLNAVTSLMRNERFYIEGINFTPTRNGKVLVQIYIDGRLSIEDVPVSEQGTFQVAVTLSGAVTNGVEIKVKQDNASPQPILLIKNVSVTREYEEIEKEKQ